MGVKMTELKYDNYISIDEKYDFPLTYFVFTEISVLKYITAKLIVRDVKYGFRWKCNREIFSLIVKERPS